MGASLPFNIACNMGPDSGFQWFEIVGSILYVEWGLVHIAAMILLILPSSRNNLTETYKGVYDKYCGDPENAKDYEALAGKWPKHAGRVYMQHALNLGFAGIFALTPYLFDVAYWISLDVPELVGIVGQLQTYIVSAGLFCFAFSVNYRFDGTLSAPGDFEKWAMYIVPCILFGLGLVQKVFGLFGIGIFNFLICGEN